MFDTPHPLSARHPPGRAFGPDLVADAGAGARSLVESGRIHLHQGRTDEALACCAAALRLKPEDAEAHRLRADALFRCRRIAAALASYDEALRCGLDPGEAVPERWMSWMLLGAFERAWEISDQVLRCRAPADRNRPDQPLHLRSVWDGSPLAGRVVLVRCYHGLGDTIQFIRYAPLLRRQAAAVVVQAQAELLPLLASVPG